MFSNVHPLHKAQGQERHSSASQSISLDKKTFQTAAFYRSYSYSDSFTIIHTIYVNR